MIETSTITSPKCGHQAIKNNSAKYIRLEFGPGR